MSNGGITLKVLSYGGVVQTLEVPDRDGRTANVSLGFGNLEDYVAHS
ncbi:MAG: aldose 1-epimerase, partial [Streptomyces sp.]|nr:aldose 1-epimerase [Streptomyces sp.]